MDEHRAHERVRVSIRIAYRDTGYAYKIGRVSNISRGGAFIVTSSPAGPVNEFMTASIDVEDLGKIIWVQGRVVRKNGAGMGIAFTRIDGKGLDLYLSHLGIPY